MTSWSVPLALGAALGLAVGLAACSGSDNTPAVDRPAVATPGSVPEADGFHAADVQAVYDHRLTMPQVRQWERAYHNLDALGNAFLEFQRRHEESLFGDDDETELRIDEMVAAFNSDATIRRAIESAGIPVRDFVLTGAAVGGAYMLTRMRQAGVSDASSPLVSEQHLAFVEENFAEVEGTIQRVGEMSHRLHDDEDDNRD